MIQININDIANKVRSAALTGLDTALTGAIVAGDTVLQAFGKIQNQINAINSSLGDKLEAGDNVSELTNDAGYVDSSGAASAAPIQTVTGTAVDNTDPANPVIDETGGGEWGSITGTLADQTDLNNALGDKADQADLNSHTGDATIHFAEGDIDHANIQNIGTNTHADIDSHIEDDAKHRQINDSGSGATDLWSAQKIGNELGGKADSGDIVTDHSGLNLDDGTNPHGTTKEDVGLSNVDNVQQYPISNPAGFETPTELNARDAANRNRANHTGTQTSGTISDFGEAVESSSQVALNIQHRDLTNNPHTVTKAQVGLSDVDNTSDADKPVSTAQQNALDDKANDDEVVKLTGDQTVDGVKTFNSSPVVPAPTTDMQAATKKYVDDNAGGGGGGIEITTEITSATTLTAAHANKYIPVNSATDLDITIDGSVFAANDQIVLEQTGNGVITVVQGTGMTLNGPLKSWGQYSTLAIFFKSATVATVIGGSE